MEVETNLIKETFNSKEAAEFLGISLNTLYRLQDLPHIRIAGKFFYRKKTLEKYIDDNERTTQEWRKQCRK